jgi:hypothetical protein
MAYRALKTFAGVVTMVKGEVREIKDDKAAKDLLRAGYIVDLSEKQRAAKSSKSTKTKEVEVDNG